MKLGVTLNFIWKNKHTRIVLKKTIKRKSQGGISCQKRKHTTVPL